MSVSEAVSTGAETRATRILVGLGGIGFAAILLLMMFKPF